MHTDIWVIKIFLNDDETQSWADARLVVAGRERQRGYGSARRDPADPYVPDIGVGLATSRALFNLATKLLRAAETDIENRTHKTAQVHP